VGEYQVPAQGSRSGVEGPPHPLTPGDKPARGVQRVNPTLCATPGVADPVGACCARRGRPAARCPAAPPPAALRLGAPLLRNSPSHVCALYTTPRCSQGTRDVIGLVVLVMCNLGRSTPQGGAPARRRRAARAAACRAPPCASLLSLPLLHVSRRCSFASLLVGRCNRLC
jgi:hypothetical protein